MTTPSTKRTVKAWAIVIEDFIVPDDPVWNKIKSPLAIYRTRSIAAKNTASHDIVPVTITFVPTTPKGRGKKRNAV